MDRRMLPCAAEPEARPAGECDGAQRRAERRPRRDCREARVEPDEELPDDRRHRRVRQRHEDYVQDTRWTDPAPGPSPGRRPGAESAARHTGHAHRRAGSRRADGGMDRATRQPGRRGSLRVDNVDSLATVDTEPSASPSTSPGYQRVHGYVQSVASGSLALKTDDGQTLTVDTTAASGTTIAPGDVVSVTGKMEGQGRLRAELIQKDH